MIKELKEICNLIVGEWSCENDSHRIIFHLNDTLLRNSKLTIINADNQQFNMDYGVAVLPNTDKNNNYRFYFDAGGFNKKYFLIKSLTKDKLVLDLLVDFIEQGEIYTYVRKIDTEFSNKVIQDL